MATCVFALLAGLVLGGCGNGDDAASEGGLKPDLLLVLSGSSGSFAPGAATDRAVLELRGVSPAVTLFSDRPERTAGLGPVDGLVARWQRLFRDDPPNAAVQILEGRDGSNTVVVELGRPRYQPRSADLSFAVRVVEAPEGRLAAFAEQADARLPTRFGDVSVFIDGAAMSGPFNHPVKELIWPSGG